MASTESFGPPQLGDHGEPCSQCGSPMAADQRYCLNCGARRGGPRLQYEQHLLSAASGQQANGSAPAAGQQRRGPGEWSPMWAAAGLAALGAFLVIGVLLGKGSNKAPVVKVGGGVSPTATAAAPTGTGTTASNVTFKSDWPSGKTGYTVEIGTLPKTGTTADQVAAAKSAATSKGASQVGALDSDQYSSLPPGNYVIYSGVYDKKAQASSALKGLTGKFPSAKVVQISNSSGAGGASLANGTTPHIAKDASAAQVSQSTLQSLSSKSGKAYQQASKAIPNVVQTQGKPAQINKSKPAGGGSGATVIK